MSLPGTAKIPDGMVYHPVAESDRVSIYMGFNDYDTLFEARHGRGALDHISRKGEEIVTPSVEITHISLGTRSMIKSMDKVNSRVDIEHTSQREYVSMMTDPLMRRVVSPSSEIIGEGAATLTDMTEAMLTALDQQLARSSDAQEPKRLRNDNDMTVR